MFGHLPYGHAEPAPALATKCQGQPFAAFLAIASPFRSSSILFTLPTQSPRGREGLTDRRANAMSRNLMAPESPTFGMLKPPSTLAKATPSLEFLLRVSLPARGIKVAVKSQFLLAASQVGIHWVHVLWRRLDLFFVA